MAPETTAQGAPTTSTPTTPAPTQKKSVTGKVVLGIIVVLIAFGIYKAASGNRAPETPDGVVSRMMQNMKGVTTGEFGGTLAGTIEGAKNPLSGLESFGKPTSESAEQTEDKAVAFNIEFSGSADMTDVEKAKTNIRVALTSPDFPSGQSAEIEFRTTEGNKYFKLNKIPVLGTLNLASLAGTWVNLDTKALKEQFGSATSTETTVSTTPLSEDKKTRIKNIITSAKLFEVTEDMGDANVAGTAVYHYKVTLNEAEVMRVAREVQEIAKGKSMSIEEEKKMTEFWESTDVENGEIWIGKKDFLLYGISFNLKTEKTGEEPSRGAMGVDLQMRNFNKPVTVEAPANASTITDFVGQVFGIIMAQSFGSSFSEGNMMGR